MVLDQDDDGCISYDEFVAQFGALPRQSARETLGNMSKELQDVIRKNKSSLRKIFHAFDEDGDGSISASELRLGLRTLNLDVSAVQVKDMISLLDANGDGSIDWNEFQAVFGGENVVAKGISRSYRRVLVRLLVEIPGTCRGSTDLSSSTMRIRPQPQMMLTRAGLSFFVIICVRRNRASELPPSTRRL